MQIDEPAVIVSVCNISQVHVSICTAVHQPTTTVTEIYQRFLCFTCVAQTMKTAAQLLFQMLRRLRQEASELVQGGLGNGTTMSQYIYIYMEKKRKRRAGDIAQCQSIYFKHLRKQGTVLFIYFHKLRLQCMSISTVRLGGICNLGPYKESLSQVKPERGVSS